MPIAGTTPNHNPSKNLSPNELQCLYEILGSDQLALTMAVAQVLHGYDGRWHKRACGVLCYIKDSKHRAYCFRLFNLRTRAMIYEENVFASTRLEKSVDLFYTFDGMECKVGVNFVDRDEAQRFCYHFNTKQEDRLKKKIKAAEPKEKMIPVVSQSLVAGKTKDVDHKTTGISSFFSSTIRGKKPSKRLEISAPLKDSYRHVDSVTVNGTFFTDEEFRKLYEDALGGMNLSVREKDEVRKAMGSAKGEFDEYFKNSVVSTIEDPSIRRRSRGPHQDLAMPSLTNFQKKHQTVLSQTPDQTGTTTTTTSSPIAQRAHRPPPPPPIEKKPEVLPANSSGPPPPPPPPPLPPDFFSSPSSAPLSDKPVSPDKETVRPPAKGLLGEIENFNPIVLKKPEPAPVVKETPNAKLTMEEFIIDIIKRRQIIRPEEEEDNGSDWSD